MNILIPVSISLLLVSAGMWNQDKCVAIIFMAVGGAMLLGTITLGIIFMRHYISPEETIGKNLTCYYVDR